MFLWRAGQQSLNVRDYMLDKEEYPQFWRDVFVANAEYQRQEDEVRELFERADEMLRQARAGENKGQRGTP